jgi:hypothetical protein
VLDSSVLVPVWSRLLLSTLAAAQPIHYTAIWCEWIIAETKNEIIAGGELQRLDLFLR